jgi:hypothetical protein
MLVNAQTLTVTVSTNPTCGRHQLTSMAGSLKLDGSLLQNGLIAVEIKYPDGNILTLRTLNTGANPSSSLVDIKNVSCTDFDRNPVTNVVENSIAYYTVFVENKAATTQQVVYYINVYDNSNTPIGHASGSQQIQPNSIISATFPVEIPSWVADGRATVFASAYTTIPDANGVPYCPEKSSTFTINGQQGASPPTTLSGSGGNYNLSLRVPRNAPLGQYSIIISSTASGASAYTSGVFNVYQPADFFPTSAGDGIVNSADIAAFVNAYIKYYAGDAYDRRADMDNNGVVNSADIAIFVNAYITYYSWY